MADARKKAEGPFTRILIIGCPGGGKSTLARRLGDALGIPIVHLDKLYWRTGWTNVTSEAFDRQLEAALAQDAFLIDGNFARTLPRRLQRAEAVIWLDLPRMTCLFGVLRRIITTYGRTRPDMGDGCRERFDPEFIKYIWLFRNRTLPEVLTALETHPDVYIIRLQSRRACKAFLERALQAGGIYPQDAGE